METSELYRGRMIDHLQLVVADLERSKRFYRAVLDVFGIAIAGEGPGFFWADELVVSSADSPAAGHGLTGRTHFALQAPDREAVERFYRVGLDSGGRDNGAPGVRPYHPGYFAAFLLDPDGNNVEAVHHGPAKRSAAFIKLAF
jgi:catechol 2,3-dioxygenase-like lactoylglutathione lyase family enzyme